MRLHVAAVASVLALTAWSPAEAQRNCSRGKPCGNSCIAQSSTCRIGAPSPQPQAPAPTARDPLATAPAVQPLYGQPAPAGAPGMQAPPTPVSGVRYQLQVLATQKGRPEWLVLDTHSGVVYKWSEGDKVYWVETLSPGASVAPRQMVQKAEP